MNKIETVFVDRTKSIFSAFGTIVNDFYLEVGIYFVGGFNATIVAWGVYSKLIADEQPLVYALLLGIITLIAVEGLAVYLVTAAARTKNAWLWFFSILFATFFTFAHIQEMKHPGIIAQYITQAVPFFIVVGYWARTIKLDTDMDTRRILDEEAEALARTQLLEDEDRRHRQDIERLAEERKYELKIARINAKSAETGYVKAMPNIRQKPAELGEGDTIFGKVNSQKKVSKSENLGKLRQLLHENPEQSAITLAAILNVNRQTIYNYKKELETNTNGEV